MTIKKVRDGESIEWSEDGTKLTIITNGIYGTDKIYGLDLIHKKVIQETATAKLEQVKTLKDKMKI